MKKNFKRFLAALLTAVMVLNVGPASVIVNALVDGVKAQASETVLDAAIFCSDVHGSTSDLSSVLGGVKTSGVDYSSIGFVGDTCLTVANTTSTVQNALGDTNIKVMFSYAKSHDTENSADISTNWNYSGEVEGVSDYYLVYTIRETDMQNSSDANTAAPAFTTWYNALTDVEKALPIFIMSHRPLHDRRDDNAGAATWYTAISDAAETSDIVFFWAHNHTGESSVDTAAYYVAKDGDETFTVYNGDTVTPNFTYMNAGYINANGQNPARIGVATTVQITADSLIFQDYNSAGTYIDSSYSHNVTVAREFAPKEVTLESIAISGTTEYYVGDALDLKVTATYSDGSTADVTKDVTLSGYDMNTVGTQTVTATCGDLTATTEITVSVREQTFISEDTYAEVTATATGGSVTNVYDETNEDVNALLSYWRGYELVLEGQVEETTATVKLWLDYDVISSNNLAVYYFNETTGEYEAVTNYTVGKDEYDVEYIVIENAALGTYVYGTPNTDDEIPEGAVLDSISIEIPATTTRYFETDTQVITDENGEELTVIAVNITGMIVKANYVLDGETYSKTIVWNEFDSTVDGYALTSDALTDGENVLYGEKTVTLTYGGKNAQYTIWVCKSEETLEDLGVYVTFDKPSVIALTVIAEAATETIATALAEKLESNLMAYNINAEYAGNDTALSGTATVTLPIPEGVTNPAVYYVSDDGATVEEMTVTNNGDGTVSFTTDHFSIYVIGDTAEETEKDLTLGGTTTTTKTVYVLTSSISSDNSYLIVDGNAAGSCYALANNSGSVAATGVTVKTDDTIGTYIELDDATDELWTVNGSSETSLKNGNYYLTYRGSRGNYSPDMSSTDSPTWKYSNNQVSIIPNRNRTTYYLVYESGWEMDSSEGNVYFYVPTEIEVTVDSSTTYEVEASDIEHIYSYNEDGTINTTETELLTYSLLANGTVTSFDGEVWTVKVVSDPSGIIDTTNSTKEALYFTGKTGTATLRVYYELDGNGDGDVGDEDDYKVWTTFTVKASEPYYSIDLHKANSVVNEVTGLIAFEDGVTYYIKNDDGTYTKVTDTTPDTSVTYYYVTYTLGDEITETIAIKGIEAGDKYGVWAVVKYYDGTTEGGEDMGSVGSDIEWTSSDETIATVDPVTGIITFTGKEGTVNITATYLGGNKPSDTITISVTQSQYSVPADGTTDFPEYPNEGAIRYDKTATAVGNFSETGIAQVELSMTGVPYTTGAEIDVVIMLDMTGSMSDTAMTAAEESAIAFAEQIVKNSDGTYNSNRICIMAFNSGSSSPYTYWTLGTVSTDTAWDSLCTAVRAASENQVSGGTPYDEALAKCREVLQAAKTDGTGNDRQQFCVFVSDGGPTSYEYITNYDEVKAGTATEYTTSSASATGGANQSDSNFATIATYTHEYYSTLMKDDGVTMYSVLTGLSKTNYPNCAAILENIASDSSKAYVVEDGSDTSAITEAFTAIAVSILQAATDITVEDQITPEYTMIFDIPTGTEEITGVTNDFYIEFLKYTLDENHERTTSESVTKLYLKNTDGVYSAASDSSGTAYAAPVFAQSTIGDKGTLYYWTTDSNYADKAAVTYSDGTNTYYFIPYGMEVGEDGSAPENWYNMTSGGYASGNVDSETNMSTDLVIATPYFVYNAATRMLYWTVDKIDTYEYALRYFLYLDKSATEVGTDNELDAGTYPTNEHAYITYTNFKGSDCRVTMPEPQLTWNGAQVSYVFYLVNAAGQPINKSGQVVDFANAVFVTDIYTTSVVWNKGTDGQIEGDANLSVDWLADKLLPSDYLLYDTEAGYELKVYADATGESIFNYFTIEGSTAADISNSLNSRLTLSTTESNVSVETTKVYNTKAATKYSEYGTYTSKATDSIDNETVLDGFDFSNSTVAFAVVWQPKLVPDTVVVDFGLDVLINVVQNDFLQNTISGIGLGEDAYGSIAMNTGVATESKLGTAALTTPDGSTISIENENQVRFHQNDMTFKEPVTFYYESPVKFYENSEQKDGYMYSSVTVIPATTVYYEDSFIDFTTQNSSGNEVDNQWMTEGTTISATQDQDRPGVSQISAALDADNNYGYDSAYADKSTFSMGSAKKITVDSSIRGIAEFSFYGTGFDVISMTSNTTGTLIVQVYSGSSATGTPVKTLVVDTYYGMNADGSISVNTPNSLYQVPVMKVSGLTYGQYTAKIIAGYNDYFNHTGVEGKYDLYLDAIRIYDPTGNENAVANGAYVADGEGWPKYTELRNNIIAASKYEVTENADGTVTVTGSNLEGAIFIDCNDGATSIADYVSYGPNNELYLAAGQAIAFNVTVTDYVADVQLGIKVGNGDSVNYTINGDVKTISTTTDMYYSIKDYTSGTVVIQNTSEGILSLTNIKVTYKQDPASIPATTGLLWMDDVSVGATVMSLRSVAPQDPEVEETTPEVTEPETTEPETEATEPETTESETVETETESEVTEPETEETESETAEPETEETASETTESEEESETESSGSGSGDAENIINSITNMIKNVANTIKNLFSKWFR